MTARFAEVCNDALQLVPDYVDAYLVGARCIRGVREKQKKRHVIACEHSKMDYRIAVQATQNIYMSFKVK